MTMLAELVETSRCVAGTSGRNAKVAALAALLKKLDPDEIAIAVAYLSGETLQGRSGVGYALLRDARPTGGVDVPTLSIADTDAALAALATTSGAGSKTARTRLLQALLERATEVERDFLTRLLIGELRQGALESLVIDAVAVAASLPASAVRSAAMLDSGLILASDSRTHAGVDNFAKFCKMNVFERAGDRVLVLLSSGNLAGTQAVIGILRQRADAGGDVPSLWTSRSMFDTAMTLVELALGYVNSRWFVGASIIGATSMAQLTEDIAAAQRELTPDALAAIAAVQVNFPSPAG